MSMENVVAVQIPPKTITEIIGKIKEIDGTLSSQLISLTTEQRKDVLPMGDTSEPFVDKALQYAKSNPEFLPAYNKIEDFEIDLKAVRDLSLIIKPMEQLLSRLKDTHLMSGAEAYKAARSYYNAVKGAAKDNAPGAKVIAEDLGKRFQGQGRTKKAA